MESRVNRGIWLSIVAPPVTASLRSPSREVNVGRLDDEEAIPTPLELEEVVGKEVEGRSLDVDDS